MAIMKTWVQTLLAASVRVSGGTGFLLERNNGARVLLTAQHVVGSEKHATVRWSGGQAVLTVQHRDKDTDIALVDADNVDLSKLNGLRLAEHAPSPGDDVAYAGYPVGWHGVAAVLQRGWVAATEGEELWFDGNANPGNSGGPVVALGEDGEIAVVGVLLGRAGNVEETLSKFQEQARMNDEAAQRFRFPMSLGGVNVIDEMLRLSTGSTRDLSVLLDRHFRTGLVRAGGLSRIRQALGAD